MADFPIRKATLDDAEALHGAHELPFIRRYVSTKPIETIRAIIGSEDAVYLVSHDGDGTLAAFAYLHGLTNPNKSVELRQLGVCAPDRGYGSAFLNAVLSYVFRDLKANRCWLEVFPENERARHVYRKAGFIEEGTLRDAYLWDGTFKDAIVAAILARDFAPRR